MNQFQITYNEYEGHKRDLFKIFEKVFEIAMNDKYNLNLQLNYNKEDIYKEISDLIEEIKEERANG